MRIFDNPLNPMALTPEGEYPDRGNDVPSHRALSERPDEPVQQLAQRASAGHVCGDEPGTGRREEDRARRLVYVSSPRGQIKARAMVTRRMSPLVIHGRLVHQVGLPFHWSFAGECVGGNANDLTSLVADPNVSMHEGKAFGVNLRAGRASNQPRQPTAEPARWSNRDPVPLTPKSAQPEGHMR